MRVTFLDVFVACLAVAILIAYVRNHHQKVAFTQARTDGKSYLVRKLDDRQDAADLLAGLTADLSRLVRHLAAKHPDREPVQRLYRNYNPSRISEGGAEEGYTSYSVNKGEKIILCLRQKENDALVDRNVIMYVAIHELAHLATKTIGHDKSFWDNFKFLLAEAVDLGVYRVVDYAAAPARYCGINISSSVI
jgi:hypothetical protein